MSIPFRRPSSFELKLFAKDQSRTVHFDKAGVVALGCNIHDQMSAFIVVTDSAWTARTDGQGMASFDDAPNAPAPVTVWHPYLRARGGLEQQTLARRPAQRRASRSGCARRRAMPRWIIDLARRFARSAPGSPSSSRCCLRWRCWRLGGACRPSLPARPRARSKASCSRAARSTTGCGSSGRTSCRMPRNCWRAISAFARPSPPATRRPCNRRSAMPPPGSGVRTAFIVTEDGKVTVDRPFDSDARDRGLVGSARRRPAHAASPCSPAGRGSWSPRRSWRRR